MTRSAFLAVASCLLAAAIQRIMIAMAMPRPWPRSWIVLCALISIVLLVVAVRSSERIAAAKMIIGTSVVWGVLTAVTCWLLYVTAGLFSIIDFGYLVVLQALSVGVLFGTGRWLAGDGRLANVLSGGGCGLAAGIVAVVVMLLLQLVLGAFLVGDSLVAIVGLGVLFIVPATMLGVMTSVWIRWRTTVVGREII